MKKFKVIMLLTGLILVLSLTACGGKKCSECGETVNDGYEVFGRFMCEDCFF